METVQQPLDRVEVMLELPPSSESLADSVRRDLTRYLQEVIQDLRLPVESSLIVRVNDGSTRSPVIPYRMWIQGRPCRVPIQTSLSSFEVMRALYVNRDLLIIANPDLTTIRVQVHPGQELLQERLDHWRDTIFDELGLILPEVQVDRDADLDEREFRIEINGLRLPRVPLGTSEPTEVVIQNLNAEVRRQAGNFLNRAVVQCGLDLLWESAPTLVDATLERFDVELLTQVLRELLEDDIGIKDFRRILEGLLALAGMGANRFDVAFCCDEARASMKSAISHQHIGQDNCLHVLLLTPEFEAGLTQYASQPGETDRVRLLEAILSSVVETNALPQVVLLTSVELRRTLRSLISREFPGLPVIAYPDLSPDIDIKPEGRIGI